MTPRRYPVAAAIHAGLRFLARYPGTIAIIYSIQTTIAVGAAWLLFSQLNAIFSQHRLLDRAATGEPLSLALAYLEHPYAFHHALWLTLAAITLYTVVSWFLSAGLIAVMVHQPHSPRATWRCAAEGAAKHAITLSRLAIAAVPGWVIVATVAIVAESMVSANLKTALSLSSYLGWLAVALAPALVVAWYLSTTVAYARIAVIKSGDGVLQALTQNAIWCASNPKVMAHALTYPILFVGVSAVYVATTWEQPPLGAAAGLLPVFGQQMTSLARTLGKVATLAGQVQLADKESAAGTLSTME